MKKIKNLVLLIALFMSAISFSQSTINSFATSLRFSSNDYLQVFNAVGFLAPSSFTGSPSTISYTSSLPFGNNDLLQIYNALRIVGAATPTSGGSGWGFSGNNISSGNFLGTTNLENLVFKTNNSTVATFSTNGVININNSLRFSQSDYTNTAVGDIFKSKTPFDGVTIRGNNDDYALTLRNGSRRIVFFVDTTVTNPNAQISSMGGSGLSLQSQGNVQMILGTNGNVGIGTTWTPTAVFQIKAGTSQYPAISLTSQTAYTGTTNGMIWRDANEDFNLLGTSMIGTGTVTGNTGSLGSVRLKQGNSFMDFGERSTNNPCIWFGNANNANSNTTSNFAIGGGTISTIVNGPVTIDQRINGANVFVMRGATSGSNTINYEFTAPATTSATASTNISTFKMTPNGRQFATGNITLLEDNLWNANSISAVGASVITDLVGNSFRVPTVGTNMTATRSWGIYTNGSALVQSNLVVGSAFKAAGATVDITGSLLVSSSSIFNGISVTSITSSGNITVPTTASITGYSARIGTTTTQAAIPTINTDRVHFTNITGLAQAITSVTMTGTPIDGQLFEIRITDNGTARAITWGSQFAGSLLPLTTVISTRIRVFLEYDSTLAKWFCVGAF